VGLKLARLAHGIDPVLLASLEEPFQIFLIKNPPNPAIVEAVGFQFHDRDLESLIDHIRENLRRVFVPEGQNKLDVELPADLSQTVAPIVRGDGPVAEAVDIEASEGFDEGRYFVFPVDEELDLGDGKRLGRDPGEAGIEAPIHARAFGRPRRDEITDLKPRLQGEVEATDGGCFSGE